MTSGATAFVAFVGRAFLFRSSSIILVVRFVVVITIHHGFTATAILSVTTRMIDTATVPLRSIASPVFVVVIDYLRFDFWCHRYHDFLFCFRVVILKSFLCDLFHNPHIYFIILFVCDTSADTTS